jgi:hypothetical protein
MWHSHCLESHADPQCIAETHSIHFAVQDKGVLSGTGQKSPKLACLVSGFLRLRFFLSMSE